MSSTVFLLLFLAIDVQLVLQELKTSTFTKTLVPLDTNGKNTNLNKRLQLKVKRLWDVVQGHYKCKLCSMTTFKFQAECNLHHSFVHSTRKTCKICSKGFADFDSHMDRIHGLKKKPKEPKQKEKRVDPRPESEPEDFVCMFCNEAFPRVRLRVSHVQTVHEAKINCPICKKRFGWFISAEKCMKTQKIGFGHLCQISRISLFICLRFI